MRVCVIAAAVIALTQPALAAKSYNKKSYRHHVSHLSHHRYSAVSRHRAGVLSQRRSIYAMARADAVEEPAFGNPFFQEQSWGFSAAPQSGLFGAPAPRTRGARVHDAALDEMIARHAAANGLPAELVHRVVRRESGYNPRARNGSNLGLMQIKYATARGVGYTGPASGLMDPETNVAYATRYLAGAYRAAGGNMNRAIALYASGYYRRGAARDTRTAAMGWSAQ